MFPHEKEAHGRHRLLNRTLYHRNKVTAHIESKHDVDNYRSARQFCDGEVMKLNTLHPMIHPKTVADIIAKGTALGAFRASSLM